MSNEVLSIVYADVPGFAAGTVVSNVVVSIADTSVTPATTLTQTVAPGTAAVTFPNLDAGSYTFSVAGVDAAGTVLGTAVTGTFVVAAPATISLSLPSTVTAAQA